MCKTKGNYWNQVKPKQSNSRSFQKQQTRRNTSTGFSLHTAIAYLFSLNTLFSRKKSMASLELMTSSQTEEEAGRGRRSSNGRDESKGSMKIIKRKAKSVSKFGCFRSEEDGGLEMEPNRTVEPSNPTHLVIMVNGLIGRLAHSSLL